MIRSDVSSLATTQGWLAGEPAWFQKQLLDCSQIRECEAGKLLFEAGDMNTGLIGLVRGNVGAYWDHPQLGRTLVHVAEPVVWFGEGMAYGLGNRALTVRAKSSSTLVFVPRQAIEALISEQPMALKSFGRLTSQHVRELLRMAGELLYQDPFARVAARIVSLCEAYNDGVETRSKVLHHTQDDLAMLTNLSRKTLNRVLSEFKKLGVVEPGYGSITVVNIQKLCEIASGAASESREDAKTLSADTL